MPMFHWRALDEYGQVVEGEMEAPDSGVVAASLLRRGCRILASEPIGAALLPPGFRGLSLGGLIRRRRLTVAQSLAFSRSLAVLLDAGHPTDRCLDAIARMAGDEVEARIATDLLVRVRNGASLSQAMEAAGECFPAPAVRMVRSGERMGGLSVVMNRLAELSLSRLNRRRLPVLFHAFVLDIPWAGRIDADGLGADLLRRMGVLIAYGIPLPQAMEMAAEVSPNRAFVASVQATAQAIRQGVAFEPAWQGLVWLPRQEMESLVKAEAAGHLPEAALMAADSLALASSKSMTRFAACVSVLSCMGGLVGFGLAS